MHFLFVTSAYIPAKNSGGPVETVATLAEGLVTCGHAVTIAALNEDDGEIMPVPLGDAVVINGVRVFYFATKTHFLQSCLIPSLRVSAARRWEDRFKSWARLQIGTFDVVHLHLGLLGVSSWLSRLAKKHNKRVLYHQRGNLDPRRFGANALLKQCYIRWIEAPILKRCDVLIALSEREKVVYRMWCRRPKRIALLPNGVDVDKWNVLGVSRRLEGTLRDMGHRDLPRVVWFARWDRRKGPDIFVEAIKILKDRGIMLSAILSGPAEGAVLNEVREQVGRLGLNEDVAFFLSPDEAEKVALLSGACCYVLPTQGEGFSVGILEAMAAGAKVVTTPEANFPELNEDGVGIVVACQATAFADAIAVQVLNKNSEENRKRARAYVESRYRWSDIVNQYLKIVMQV